MGKIVHVVAAAFQDAQGRILLAQRPAGKAMAGLWEFPGGKLEQGETPEAALVRELREELGLEVAERDLEAIQFVSHAYENFHLVMLLYGIRRWSGTLHPHEGQEFAWVAADALTDYPMPPADIPLMPALLCWAGVQR
jgi:8-oxo-dGTP diphosphatase